MSMSMKSIGVKLNRFPAYISRLPPCTRVLILATVLASTLDVLTVVDVRGFGALVPDKISIFAGEHFRGRRGLYLVGKGEI